MIKNELLKKLCRKMVADPQDYMSSFRRNLLTYIEEKDITLSAIAEEANMSVETLKTLVYGNGADCKLSTAINLARALHISVDELVGAGTISPTMCESIQIVRNLPDNFVYFLRWTIRYNERMLKEKKASKKAINVMLPECCNDGNLRINTDFELMDISDLPDDKRYKVFMGIQIPCEHYMPAFSPGDILLLANDRRPMQSENVVVVNDGYIRIVKWREERDVNGEKRIAYYTVRRNSFMAYKDEVDDVIGYIVAIRH